MNGKSQTMRIDLIPEISAVPLSEQPKAAFMPAPPPVRATSSGSPAMQAPVRGGYDELFQNIYDAAIVTDLHGRVRDVNRRASWTFGYTAAQFSHLTIDRVVAGADADLVRTLHENLRRECFTLLQASCIRADGTSFPAEVSVSPLRLSTPHLCFFVRDETVRRQTDEMLRTEHNALQNASDAIVVIDQQAKIEYANPATARTWGFSSATDLTGRSLGDLLANPADALAVVNSLSGENYDTAGVAIARRADGEPFRVEVRAACNRDSDGNVTGAVLSFSDLTERDRVRVAEHDAEAARSALQRLARLNASFDDNIAEISARLEQFRQPVQADSAAASAFESAAGNLAALQSLLADAREIVSSAMRAPSSTSPSPLSLD